MKISSVFFVQWIKKHLHFKLHNGLNENLIIMSIFIQVEINLSLNIHLLTDLKQRSVY